MNKEEQIKIMNHIKMVRRVLDFGYEKALLYADIGEEEEFTKTLENKSRLDLIQEVKSLKEKIYKSKPADGKFCIRKCKGEYIPRDGYIEVYCSSCDRIIGKKTIKK